MIVDSTINSSSSSGAIAVDYSSLIFYSSSSFSVPQDGVVYMTIVKQSSVNSSVGFNFSVAGKTIYSANFLNVETSSCTGFSIVKKGDKVLGSTNGAGTSVTYKFYFVPFE